MSHWKNDCNQEPLNFRCGLRPCSPVINQSVRDARAQLQTGHQNIRTYELPVWAKTMLPRYQPKRSRRSRTITHRSSKYPQLFLQSNGGHHGPHSRARTDEPSTSLRTPCGYSAALSERRNQNGHAQNRSRRHRSGSNLSYIGIDKTGLK
jgi:hypothetical protein